jgi:ABC-type sulfate transport system permease component
MLIYDLNESGDLAAISVFGLFMLMITFTIVALADTLRGRNARRNAAVG